MKILEMSHGEAAAVFLAIMSASVSPLAFTISAGTNYSLDFLALYAVLPSVVVFFLLISISLSFNWRRLSYSLLWSIVAGVAGTLVMEVVRATGFRVFGGMPGSLPMLMGVLMTDRIMDGPNVLSNLIGWGDHFFNGIGFAALYLILLGRVRWWWGVLYALVIATVFMLSPVMNIIGAGYFGQDFAPVRFPLTVYMAHLVYGIVVGLVAWRAPSIPIGIVPKLYQKLVMLKAKRVG
ncbi:hypothetical protein QO259_17670 [Salinicola sp. JS01]|uniref:hypothetical protein n=1 Tax=Salinicola sp. JS01 TaxID=3050071 RepID=UPI00255BD68E|nr:hypothetical protein [Salinicola sp. JS01]WIX32613.1 hypothetical protein QO259_17670 [Salinicola sp. JS01]